MDCVHPGQTVPSKNSRIYIACIRCKSRKRRCGGETPKCANCTAHNAECIYAAIRKTRGLGKRNNDIENLEQTFSGPPLELPSEAPKTGNYGQQNGADSIAPITAPSEPLSNSRLLPADVAIESVIANPTTCVGSSKTQMSAPSRLPIFPDFLLPDQFDQHKNTLKGNAWKATATRTFIPLMPPHISKTMIKNSFSDIMAEHRLLDQSDFVTLLDAQYAASLVDPDGNPARWALVNAIIALGLRVKTASGSEIEMSDIVQGFYRNATTVVSEIILQEPSLLSIQALLAMAMFARGIPDTRAFIMLTTNASRQLELFSPRQLPAGQVVGMQETQQYKQVYNIAHEFDEIAGLIRLNLGGT